ncbi:hypothetical protein D3C78_1480220 [compost metagenome]
MTVAIRIVGVAHSLICIPIHQQAVQFTNDIGDVGADQLNGASSHSFRTLGGITHHQYRLAEGGGLLLNSAGVGEDDMGAAHQVHKRQVVQRLDQMDIIDTGEQSVDRFAHVGIEVHGVNNVDVLVLLGNLHQGLADALEATTEAFPTVARYQDQLAR